MNSKFFNYENIKTIFLDKFDGKTREEEEILKAYKRYKLTNGKNNPNVIFQWKWKKGKPKPEETIYEEGDDGFEELKKCEQFALVIIENRYKIIRKNGTFLFLRHLYRNL